MAARRRAFVLLLGLCGVASLPGQTLDLPERGKPELALLAGFGYSVKINRGSTEEQALVLEPQAGFRLGPRFEYLMEGHLARYFRPDGFAAGLVPVDARYFFGTGKVAPYLELGVGFCWTNLDVEEINRRFNFILQGGLGVVGSPERDHTWTLEARWLHYSNAGTVLPNLGLNTIVLLLGWRFR
ncbi:MAG TPA: acyloxyacyl hydrolase [Thermoanaerobaculia bacterium]|nr:acyloxyacyl hydrolase [Thermoanaerobaculia bacterium]